MATKAPPNPSRLKLARPLYGPSNPKGPSKGPDVIAVKRALSRAFPDEFEWADFDLIYNQRLSRSMQRVQAAHGISPITGNYGKLTHELLRTSRRQGHPTEWAYDATAINLMQAKWEDIHNPPPDPEVQVKAAAVDFMRKALAAADLWSYSWARPMSGLGRDPRLKQISDCSGGVTEVLYWVKMVTGIMIPDPNGRGWDGYGNTDSLWATNSSRIVTGTYEVGDMALYWAHSGHVTMCMEPGGPGSAVWWSNGSQSAPNTTSLHYRTDLRGVVRPRLVL